MPSWCSVEKLVSPENHDVQGEGSQADFPALRPIGACSKCRTQQAFEHAIGGFDLPALTVLRARQDALHHSSPVAARRLCGWSSNERRNQRPHALAASIQVAMLAIVGCIRCQP